MMILLADDHKLLRDCLRPLLGRVEAQVTVIEASDLAGAVAAAETAGHLDLALLDLRMPGMDGLTGLMAFMERFPATRVVLLSAFGDLDTVLAAIKAGAAGFIPKTIGGQGFVNALRLIMSGEVYVPGQTLLEAGEHLSPAAEGDRGAVAAAEPVVRDRAFTPREGLVMDLLVDGMPNKEIARRLQLHEATVKACLRSIYRKMGVLNRTQAVKAILSRAGHLT
jgi:DNA-binding NarL/FixJ family response regulator